MPPLARALLQALTLPGLLQCTAVLDKCPNVTVLPEPSQEKKLTVVGDLHGNLQVVGTRPPVREPHTVPLPTAAGSLADRRLSALDGRISTR